MNAAPAHYLNGVKVEDVSHLRGMGCYLRLWVQTSHGQLMLVHSRLQPSAGFPDVVVPSAAALKSVDNGGHRLLRDRIFWRITCRHVFNFDAVEIVGRGGVHTATQVQEAWMSTDCSVNRHINLPPPYLTLRTFLAGDSHGAGQSGPSVISAADGGDSGHGDMRVGCSHTGGIGGSRIEQSAPYRGSCAQDFPVSEDG
ncbi:hypothetical protein SprV_0301170300 [Sparganum proliferum]